MVAVALIPPKGLHGFASCSNIHMVLGVPVCFNNNDYVEFYRGTQNFKILDNGANESGRALSADQLFFYAETVKAHEIVLPDVMGNRDRTINAVDRFLDAHFAEASKYQCMAVIHATTARTALNTAKYYMESPYIQTIGLPRILSETLGQVSARLDLAQAIERTNPGRVKIHFLGAISNWPREIASVAKYAPFVRSLDTSLPFNYTVAGRSLKDNPQLKIGRTATYFTRDYGGMNKVLIKENIDTYLGWASEQAPSGEL